MVIGIGFSFIGKSVDAAWWAIPWSLAYVDHQAWASFNNAGVFFNVVFRQAFSSYAAYCHIRAFSNSDSLMRSINFLLLCSIVIGQIYPLILEILNHSTH